VGPHGAGSSKTEMITLPTTPPARRRFRHCSVPLLLLLAPACVDFAPGSDVLESEQGEAFPATPPGEDWSCLEGIDDVRDGPARSTIASPETRIIYSGQILDLSTGAIYPDIRVRACGIADIECTAPVAEDLAVDGSGWVDIPVFEGFTGFFEFSSPAILDTIFFVNERVEQPTRQNFPLIVVSRASVPPLLQLIGSTQQQNTGFVAIRARDCNDDTAPGVTFSLEGEGTPYYFVGDLPTGSASATDNAGIGGYANVQLGRVVVTATNSAGVQIMPPQALLIRDGWLSEIIARPPQELRTADD
jgi:hypothetical protein